ncbi:MAG TPA: ATP-binding cassette domain-containing protein [Roseiarcus sp.]|jgi:peptide/nickel transport system ATP-binding protein
MSNPLLEVCHASRTFSTGVGPFSRDVFTAVDDVSLRLEPGRTLGVVGESGSGKSTLLRMILRLIRPTSGEILFEGRDIWTLSGRELLAVRRRMQAIFQDPASSFNPRQSIGAILAAPLEVHRVGTRAERARTVVETLELVGLSPSYVSRRPHQLSGGQRQRVAIARAIILRPSLIVADEPTSALDVSVQAQILALLQKTNRDLGLACVFVSHNLGVIRVIADDVAVMRRGKIVEAGTVEQVFEKPQDDYTRALIDAVPDPSRRRSAVLSSQPVAQE